MSDQDSQSSPNFSAAFDFNVETSSEGPVEEDESRSEPNSVAEMESEAKKVVEIYRQYMVSGEE